MRIELEIRVSPERERERERERACLALERGREGERDLILGNGLERKKEKWMRVKRGADEI